MLLRKNKNADYKLVFRLMWQMTCQQQRLCGKLLFTK